MAHFYLDDGHKEAYFAKLPKAMLWWDIPGSDGRWGLSEQLKRGNWLIIFELLKKSNQYMIMYFVSKIIYFLMYIVAGFGLWRAYRIDKKIFGVFLLFLSLFVYISVAAGPYGAYVRYRLPVMPGLLLIFSYGLFQIIDKVRQY